MEGGRNLGHILQMEELVVEVLGSILVVVGMMVVVAGGLWILVLAFQESVGWGIACLLCGIAQIIFLIQFWDRCSKPFLIQLAGLALAVIGAAMSGLD